MTLCRHVSAIPLRAVLAVSSYGTSENSLKARAWPVMIYGALKPQPCEVKSINEGIDHPDRIVLVDPILQPIRKQRHLVAIGALYIAVHHILRDLGESYLTRAFPHRLDHN